MKPFKEKTFKMVETGMMLVALWWGVVLALPAHTFANPVYGAMSHLMPEKVWSALCIVIGLTIGIGMFLQQKLVQTIGLLASIGFWIFVAVALWLGDHFTTGTSYAVWAVLASWLYIHLIKEGDG
ncbi:hypothetical protein [Metabacillus fastidiosus]|uniref:hypothetical protein n=1 Tax=Metabacillus fastidiosus TaxID=1458 RepID=UPI003D2AEA44